MQVDRPLRPLVHISLIFGLLSFLCVIRLDTHAQETSELVLVERVIKDSGKLPWVWNATDVSVGRGGHHFVYPRRGDTKFVWLDGVKSREYDKVVKHPKFSPDGTHVVWVAEVDGRRFVILDGKEGKHYDGITDDEYLRFYPVFSPDSRHLAYYARTGAKWVCVLDGREGPEYDRVEQVRFSADSQHLAYVAWRAGKEFVVFDGKEDPPYDEVCIYAIAPGGSRLAYVGYRGGKKLVVCDGRESAPYDDIGRVRLSPDGRRLVYAAKRAGRWFIVVDGKEGPAYDRLIYVEFSPDSRHLVYTARRQDKGLVGLVVLDGHEEPWRGSWPHFSPDSKLVYVTYHSETKTWSYVYDGKLWPCGTSPERFSQAPPMYFTPDGRHFAYYAYEKGKGLWIVRDGKPGKVFRWADRAQWSPDGNHLFYTARRKGGPNHVVCDDLINAVARSAYCPTFSKDSRHFAYRIFHDDTRYQVVCDGVKGPAHWEIRGLRAVGGKLRYVAYEKDRVRIVEVDWPAGRTWRDGFKPMDD